MPRQPNSETLSLFDLPEMAGSLPLVEQLAKPKLIPITPIPRFIPLGIPRELSYCINHDSPHTCGECHHLQLRDTHWGVCSIHTLRDQDGYGNAIHTDAPMPTYKTCCFQFLHINDPNGNTTAQQISRET